METRTLETPEVDLVHDVAGPLPPADGRPPLLMIGQPMDASGFRALASHFDDRTVVTYDPRGLGRSIRHDGRTESDPEVQARDLHALVASLGAGPVDVFASSGGAVTALAWVAAFPDDVATLVAHEPPLISVLPDAEAAVRGYDRARAAYEERGWGAGMAAFVGFTSWPGEFTDEFFAQPLPDPAAFGMPTQDDGSRDDPILSDRSQPVVRYAVDVPALEKAPTRVVMAVGAESAGIFTARTTGIVAAQLDQQPMVFPGGHGGFAGEQDPWPGQATAFAARLREVFG
ncbi:alpha/beta hydrolase [Actinomycetospora endophytica]|uniref:Alpha/beta hydrolase n=1 Tax=Actinomycetospora endophytica TaxID=2291215 RepID=A0ABS8PGZ7_9PSEU|nr:alpha/beta hydrolase [Actinomycetospora endophytica]MCD2197517.1 alpha/beta hydrolase [Actinomycetospora endophytica]